MSSFSCFFEKKCWLKCHDSHVEFIFKIFLKEKERVSFTIHITCGHLLLRNISHNLNLFFWSWKHTNFTCWKWHHPLHLDYGSIFIILYMEIISLWLKLSKFGVVKNHTVIFNSVQVNKSKTLLSLWQQIHGPAWCLWLIMSMISTY